MNKLITLLLLLSCVTVSAASLEMKVVKQKTLPNGRPYGLAAGIYFEVKDMEPLIMHKIQYSKDLKTWIDLVQITTWYNSMTSPYWTWKELPPYQCFFRVVVAW